MSPRNWCLRRGPARRSATLKGRSTKNNQQLAFEPPDYSKLLGGKHRGTLGGLMACGLSGPRRIKAGAARDHILGIAGVSGRGEIFKAGGRVVKNVTGFDVAKLMVGSYGTLAALTSITVKVLPAAATRGNPGFQRPQRCQGHPGHEPCHAVGLRRFRRGPSSGNAIANPVSPGRHSALGRLPPPEACQPPENFWGQRLSG